MLKATIFVAALAYCCKAHADQPPLRESGTPFRSTNLIVRWNVATNNIPKALWVYRATPAQFSADVVSNLMALGPFTERDKTNRFRYASDDPSHFRFALASGKSLEIAPTIGCVEYLDPSADQMEVAEGVPREDEMLKLTKAFLPKLGINLTNLAKKPNGSDLLVYFTKQVTVLYDSSNKPYTTNIHSRGVYFIRSLDGVDVSGIGGRGGCRIDIGNHGKISRISALWRKLEKDRLCNTADSETIIKWIQGGRGVLLPLRADIEPPDLSHVTSLSITNVTPYYFGERSSALQSEVFPFVTLSGALEVGSTNVGVQINCPILENPN